MTPPKIDVVAIQPKPSANIMTECKKLLTYDSVDEREVITITVKNANLYFLCASKVRSAISFLEVGYGTSTSPITTVGK